MILECMTFLKHLGVSTLHAEIEEDACAGIDQDDSYFSTLQSPSFK
jgi:hypothetical protein